MKTPLDEGDYILLANMKWPYYDQAHECSLIFSSYTDNSDFDFDYLDRKLLHHNYLYKIFASFIDKNCVYKPIGSSQKGISYVNSLKDTDTGFFFLSFKNETLYP